MSEDFKNNVYARSKSVGRDDQYATVSQSFGGSSGDFPEKSAARGRLQPICETGLTEMRSTCSLMLPPDVASEAVDFTADFEDTPDIEIRCVFSRGMSLCVQLEYIREVWIMASITSGAAVR